MPFLHFTITTNRDIQSKILKIMIMEIVKFDLKSLRNEEHYQFHTEAKTVLGKLVETNEAIGVKYPQYLNFLNDESTALDQIQKSSITDDILVANQKRNSLFRGLSDGVKSALNHYDPDLQQTAIHLQTAFDHYGNITLKPANQETSAYDSLSADLQGTYSNDINALGITEWVIRLKDANEQYRTLITNRNTEEANRTQLKMKDVRFQIDVVFQNITKTINALIVINGEAGYTTTVNELNQIISRYSNIIAQRQGRAAKNNESNMEKK